MYVQCEVLTDSGQSVQCELLTDSGQTVQYEVLTDSGQTVKCEVLTDSGQAVQCEVLTDNRQSVQCEVMTDSGQTVQCEVLTDSGQTATIFAVFATKLSVRLSLHFVAFVFFYKAITVTMGHCPVSYMLLVSPLTILRPLSPLYTAKYKDIYLLYLIRIHVRHLVFWSIRSIAQFCNVILPNIHYLLPCTIIIPLKSSIPMFLIP